MRITQKRLIELFSLTPWKAQTLQHILTGKLCPSELLEMLGSKYKLGSNTNELILTAANHILEGHGLESVTSMDYYSYYWGHTIFTYVNMGDTYNTTILYDIRKERLLVTTLGDYLKRCKYSYT